MINGKLHQKLPSPSKAKGKQTIVELLHENVPEKSVNSITDGWNAYYLGAMKEMFEEKNNQNVPPVGTFLISSYEKNLLILLSFFLCIAARIKMLICLNFSLATGEMDRSRE